MKPGLLAKFALGLVMGLLPCGLIYAALLKAAATGDPLRGAVTAFRFGIGTASALIAIGMFSSTLGRWFGRYSTQLAAAGIMLMGVFLLWRASMPLHQHHH